MKRNERESECLREERKENERKEIPVPLASTMHVGRMSEPKGFMLGQDVGASQVDQPYLSTCGDRLNCDVVSD